MSFDKALDLDPGQADAARCCALLHFEQARYEQAIASFDRLLRVKPDLAGAFKLRGVCFLNLNRLEEALASSSRASELAPADADIINNVAMVLHRLGREDEAMAQAERAIALDPAFPSALNTRARSLLAMLRFDEAITALDAAIAMDPNFALALGNFETGWAMRECGRTQLDVFIDRKFTQPQWFGQQPIAGKTILLHSDEGLGDTIQYVRYVKLVAQLGARVILQLDEALRGLVSGLEGVALCLPRSAVELPDFDFHCPLSALPLAFKTRLETIPSKMPYLPLPPEQLREVWDKRLGPHDKMRVGLVWSGNSAHGNDRKRSMTLRTLGKILDVDARFFSLQKDPRPADRATLLERSDVVDLTAHLTTFVETAAMICCLDLVISVDTSVAHLAGALGKPTWIMLPYAPDYRWLLDRADSPWYPTVRLFRQNETRDYAEVLDGVRAELKARIAEQSFASV
jgi:tetratricopeptide (TPR) repeat protein